MVKHWLPLREQKKNNRGSMLVMVIMIVAIIGILVTIMYGMSYLNLRMKYTDEKAKDTFYDAETALDEIKTGLQTEVSEAMGSAYILTLESYSQLTEDQRDAQFKNEYVRVLRQALKESGDSSKYDVSVLKDFLIKTKFDDVTGRGAKVRSTNNVIQITNQGVILKDVEITYYGKEDYVSYIKTDIVLNFPEMDFTQAAAIPRLTTYSLIANTQFNATGTRADIKGNAYLGKEGTDGGANINNSAITLEKTDESNNVPTLISGGNITLSNKAAFSSGGVELWADNITVGGSELDISGSTYLRDDLIVANYKALNNSDIGSRVKVSGNYFGYGNPETAKNAEGVSAAAVIASPADYSSAILVNGAGTEVNLSGLNTMMLAGSSYIQATGQTGGPVAGITNSDSMIGESLSVKSSQSAYLIPASCVAPDSEYGGLNPMTATQYQQLIADISGNGNDGRLISYDTVVPEYGNTLSSMGVNNYKPAYFRLNSNVSMVYLFMEFDNQEAANSFFERHYSIAKNKTKLEGMVDIYTSSIRLPDINTMADNTRFYYNGNVLVNDESADNFYINKLQSVTAEEQAYLVNSQVEYQNNFAALNKKLIANYSSLTAEEKSGDVYTNLVKEMVNSDAKYNIASGSSKLFVSYGTENHAALVVNGDYTISSNHISGTDMEGNMINNAELNVVISAGDVTVKSNFEGLILAKGKIIIENRADGSSSYTLKADPTKTVIALSARNAEGVMASDYLKEAAAIMNGAGGSGENNQINLSDLITYENWKKN